MPSALLRVISRALRAAFTRCGGLDHLADDHLGFARMLLEPGLEHVVDDALDNRADLGGNELVLGLRGKLRVRHLDGENRGQSFAAIVAGERDFLLPRGAAGFGVAGDLAVNAPRKPARWVPPSRCGMFVGEAEHRLVVAVVPPHRALDAGAVAVGLDDDWLLATSGVLVAIQILDECLDAAS